MAIDSMSESCLFQLEKYFNSNPYREYTMNRPYIPMSAHSNRVNKSSSMTFRQLINNQKNSLTLDRIAYKLRIKSDLNVNTSRESYQHEHYHTNSPMNDAFNLIPRSATTKTFIRQPTAVTRTTNSIKTLVNNEINGIEGNAVHVGTLDDLIKQFHREEIRLIHHPTEYLDNLSTYTANNRLITGRITPKTPSFLSERIIKQPQALTEYHFMAPTLPRTASQVNRYRLKERRNNNIDHTLSTDQYSFKRQSTAMTSHDKRIQESREKALLHTSKQLCTCNKLTIIDPFNSEENQSTLPLTKYIFPPLRSSGYLKKKSIDDIPHSIPLLMKKKQDIQKCPKNSLDSMDHISADIDEHSHVLNDRNKSITTSTDLDDDLPNPPNTRINVNL
jgi:hypothetical protein